MRWTLVYWKITTGERFEIEVALIYFVNVAERKKQEARNEKKGLREFVHEFNQPLQKVY